MDLIAFNPKTQTFTPKHKETHPKSKNINVKAIVDSRKNSDIEVEGIPTFRNTSVVDTSGRKQISSITLSNGNKINCDCLAVSGGWNPNLHLTCHQRGKPVWNAAINAFVPSSTPENMLSLIHI